jgi:hypothetical protein
MNSADAADAKRVVWKIFLINQVASAVFLIKYRNSARTCGTV